MKVKEKIYLGKEEFSLEDVLKIRIILEIIRTNNPLGENEKNLLEYTRTFFLFRRNLGRQEEKKYQRKLDILKEKLADVISEKRIKALHSLIIDAEENTGDYSYKENLPGLYDRIDKKLSSL